MNERERETVIELRALAKGIEEGKATVVSLELRVHDDAGGSSQSLEVCTFMAREGTPGRLTKAPDTR